jgi:hypothetical protein
MGGGGLKGAHHLPGNNYYFLGKNIPFLLFKKMNFVSNLSSCYRTLKHGQYLACLVSNYGVKSRRSNEEKKVLKSVSTSRLLKEHIFFKVCKCPRRSMGMQDGMLVCSVLCRPLIF